VRELADRIIVLHNGQLVADGEPAEVMASAVVQEAYLGAKPLAAPVVKAEEGRSP
jgi:branched-chain amino acid transport system ATP-binding protein